jgi:hypothetical protein
MEKEFVPYELALRMKQLRYDGSCFAIWSGFDEQNFSITDTVRLYSSGFRINGTQSSKFYVNDFNSLRVAAPTYSQAFRWFREKYLIFPEVLTDCTTEPKFVFTYNTFYGNPKDLTEQEWGWENNIGQYSDIYRTYEDAELACLTKLIELVKEKL